MINLFLENKILDQKLQGLVKKIYLSLSDWRKKEYGLMLAFNTEIDYKFILFKGTANKIKPLKNINLWFSFYFKTRKEYPNLYFFHNHPNEWLSLPSDGDMRVARFHNQFNHYVFGAKKGAYDFLFCNILKFWQEHLTETKFNEKLGKESITLDEKGQVEIIQRDWNKL